MTTFGQFPYYTGDQIGWDPKNRTNTQTISYLRLEANASNPAVGNAFTLWLDGGGVLHVGSSSGGGSIDGVTLNTGATVIPLSSTGNISFLCSIADAGSTVTTRASDPHTISLKLSDALNNTILGVGAGPTSPTGNSNTFVGTTTAAALTSGIGNAGLGTGSFQSLTSGSQNSGFGAQSGVSLTTGTNNVLAGFQAGSSYTGSESSNICIGALGTIGDNNVIRIGGGRGSGTGQQTTTHLSGGDVTFDNGNLTFATAGNKIKTTSIGSGLSAGANSFGTVTLSSGTATVMTSAMGASTQILMTRTNVAGSTSLGALYISTFTANTSFTITSAQLATPSSTQTGDNSTVFWMMIN